MSAKSSAGKARIAWLWSRHRRLVLRAAPLLHKARLGGLSVAMLKHLDAHGHGNVEVIEALYRQCGKLGWKDEATEYRARILRGRASRAARASGMDRPIQNLLRAMAGLEQMGLAAPLDAAVRLTTLMSRDDGAPVLLAATEPVLAEHPGSLLVIYVRAVALAKTDHLQEAAALVRTATRATEAREAADVIEARVRRSQLAHLADAWRVVDSIARDKMAWAAGAEPEAEAADGAVDRKGEAEDDGVSALIDQEVLLQGRRQSRYLAACRHRFLSEPGTREKLRAIKDMLRQGLRRMPEYHAAYAAARKSYASMRDAWTPMLPGAGGPDPALVGKDGGLKTVRLLIQVLQLARELDMADDVALIEDGLLRYARDPAARTALWTVASVLVEGDPERFAAATTALVDHAGEPRKPHEVRDFLAWAARARRHDLAHAFFAGAPESMRRSYAAIHYVKILQREGQFDRALNLLRTVTGTVLATPKAFSPNRHWSLIKRIAELEFLADSARWFSAVPQPVKPRGVVMLAPRNAGQLTKYPMAVLLELKKQGWAVIPVVEGVLPAQPTGDPRIDRFIGCVLADVRMNPDVADGFKPIKGFRPEIAKGRFKWGDMDLSQPLWEEGAINRRRYNVDFTCPSLNKFLGRLVDWTRLQATVLQNARETFADMSLRAGTMVPLQARLPDAVVRFYCEQHGDPAAFFCLHASNGYENYFANFSRSFSTKCGMRNMTAHPELRTASFPVPAEFDAWYESRRKAARLMLERVRDTTKVRRSTRTTAAPPPEALACAERVRQWRAQGGKVACAFGKVVCDMAAPTDGGPAHRNMKDWLNHTIESVRGSRTLLLIKPHPHELRNEIATFLTEYMTDLIEVDLPDNVVIVGQDWFDLNELGDLIDLGLIYNGTTAVELGLMNIPAVLCADFAPTDYPIGHVTPKDRSHYRRLVRFQSPAQTPVDLPERAAAWIHYMSGDMVTIPYRYHARPLTNKVTTPPRWFEEDIVAYLKHGDANVRRLARRVTALPRRPTDAVNTPRPPRAASGKARSPRTADTPRRSRRAAPVAE
ncbi:MAG: hypothetical protein V7678_02815 [Brevundimonas sp.]